MSKRSVAFLLACCLALALGSASAQEPPRVGLEVSVFELDNGLRVILHEDHTSPTAVVFVWYRVGSKDEKPGRSGFAHLFEHLMFKGSKHVPDGEFDRLLEAGGGWSNGSTWHDRTEYHEQVPANFLELALYLEADRMAGLWSAMSQTVLDNQRDVVKNERRENYEDAPYGEADLLVQQALWPGGHGNHNPTIGSVADLDAATMSDVEEFYRTYYVPANAVLVIVGDIEPTRTRALVERYFAWIPKRPEPEHVTLTEPVKPRPGEVRLRTTDSVQVPKVLVDWRSPTPFTKGSVALHVAAQILAGGKTGRIYRRLVFDGRLADDATAYQEPHMLGGTFEIHAHAKEGVGPEPILAVIDEEVARLASEPPSEDEVTRAKNVLEAELLQGLESFVARANRLARYQAYLGTPDFLGKELRMLRDVTTADVRQAVATWLRRDARVVMFVEPEAKEAK
jgi:zinc protease